jgi:L-alanine-DL-glutamate epimerase-like enolase superfamily enzyme
MRIVDVRVLTVPIRSAIRNSVIDFSEMTVSLVALITDEQRDGRPVIGYGFNSNGRYAQTGLLNERFIPRLMSADPASLLNMESGLLDPQRIFETLMRNEKPGGHGDRAVAVGILDMAVWDAVAKLQDLPLSHAIARHFDLAVPASEVSVYAAGGYYAPDKDRDQLTSEMAGYLELGYRDVKMKIGGAPLDDDVRRIESVLEILPSGGRLAVDANGRFGIDEAIAYASALNEFDLFWYEEPCDPLDFLGHAAVAQSYNGSLATGENLHSVQDVTNLIRYSCLRPGLDVLQMDPALSYGLTEYARMLAVLSRQGWTPASCTPHGGHQFNLHIAAAFGLGGIESYPGVFQPFGGFADDVPVENGVVRVPQVPGIGLELKGSLRPLLAELAG